MPQSDIITASVAAADSIVVHARRDLRLGHECDAPVNAGEQARYGTAAPAWQSGVEASPRPVSPGIGSAVPAMVMFCFIMLLFNHRNCMRLLANFTEVLRARARANALDDATAGERRTELMMLLQTCVLESIMLYAAVGRHADMDVTVQAGLYAAVAIGYYLMQVAAYGIIGYVFAPPGYTAPLLRAFNATQAVMGMALPVPALATLFYPACTGAMLFISAMLYIAARIIFIRAGFRIFYNNFASLLYFFLYLCALEIIPLMLVYRAAVSIYVIL